MALTLSPKAPADIKRYTWAVPVAEGDGLASVTAPTSTGVTVDSYDISNDDLVLYVSGGTANATGTITVHAVTSDGEEFAEKLYIPILPTGAAIAHSETSTTIIDFALKVIVGKSGTPTTAERNDALEWLNDMLTEWRSTGADVGTPRLAIGDSVYIPDAWVGAVKTNLRKRVAEEYGQAVSETTAKVAMAGLMMIKFDRLADREPTKATYS